MGQQNAIYKCHPEQGSLSGTCHKTACTRASSGDFKGTTHCVTCDPGLELETASALTSTWIFLTWLFQSCHPNYWGSQILKKNPSKFWSTGSYSRELHIRLRILTSCWTCTKEALLDKAYAQSGICASHRLFSSRTVKQGRTSQCIAYQKV